MADLIDRGAVLAEIGEFQIRFNETGDSHERVAYASAEHCMLVIKSAPAVNRWIPVEDALPNDRKCVLVTDGEDIEFTFFDGSDWEMRDRFGNHYEMYGAVTHWMPLPEPPEKE